MVHFLCGFLRHQCGRNTSIMNKSAWGRKFFQGCEANARREKANMSPAEATRFDEKRWYPSQHHSIPEMWKQARRHNEYETPCVGLNRLSYMPPFSLGATIMRAYGYRGIRKKHVAFLISQCALLFPEDEPPIDWHEIQRRYYDTNIISP